MQMEVGFILSKLKVCSDANRRRNYDYFWCQFHLVLLDMPILGV